MDSVSSAVSAKLADGKKKYGPIFQGDPLDEFFCEMIDAVNYVRECRSRGIDFKPINRIDIEGALLLWAEDAKETYDARNRAKNTSVPNPE